MNGECADSGKQRYTTARAAYVAVQNAYWGRRTQKQPCRVYYCTDCQGYHVSSQRNIWVRRWRLIRARKRLPQPDNPPTQVQRLPQPDNPPTQVQRLPQPDNPPTQVRRIPK